MLSFPISTTFFQNSKKKIEFAGYFTHGLVLQKKNKSIQPKQSLLSQIVAYASRPLSTSSHKCTGGKANVFELMRLTSEV